MATQAQIAAVQQLYVGYLGRAADSAGQQFWANAIANGTATIASVATGFTLSNEYKATYGGLSTSDLVEQVYNNVLGRAPDADGKAFWVAALANGTVTADTLVATIVTNLGALDQQTINNKVFVAQTYTDTAGASYTPAGGAAAIAGVTNDPATVTTAVGNIASGTLPGQVVGLNLVNTLIAANAANTAYETANKAALDALAATLKVDIDKDFNKELELVSKAANEVRANKENGGTAATEALAGQVSADQKALTAAFTALNAAGQKAATAFQAAVTTDAGLKGALATDIAAVQAGLTKADGSSSALETAGKALTVPKTFDDTEALYDFYVDASTSAADRASIDKAFTDAKISYFTTFKATASVDVTKNASFKAVSDTKADVITADATNGPAYNAASEKLVADSTTLKNAQAADVNKAAADALVASNAASEKTVTDAEAAVKAFNDAHTDAKIAMLTGAGDTGTVAKESFYFGSDSLAKSSADFSIAKFAAGDSIVLGNGYTFNNGALSTGDNNKLEFFLVKSDAGVQIVIETEAYGSAEVKPDATTGAIAASNADHNNVITLTGVTIDHVSVANGVVSYV